jgi:AmmeMemoRadiSam system protein B
MFYPANADELRSMVDEMLGEVEAAPAPAPAAIAPHAGLVYSGRCAAQVWGRLVIPETVVIIAPNHTGLLDNRSGAGAWDRGVFETPLGSVPVAHEFLEEVEGRCALLRHDRAAHLREHAIEVELPFLRVLAPEARLAPIVLAFDEWEPARDLATGLAAAASRWSTEVLLMASSDMTHYESASQAARKDEMALAAVGRLDGQELLRVCRREGVSMCGRGPAAVVVEAARQLGATTAEVVDYRHSGWVTGDDAEVVAYAGVVIN